MVPKTPCLRGGVTGKATQVKCPWPTRIKKSRNSVESSDEWNTHHVHFGRNGKICRPFLSFRDRAVQAPYLFIQSFVLTFQFRSTFHSSFRRSFPTAYSQYSKGGKTAFRPFVRAQRVPGRGGHPEKAAMNLSSRGSPASPLGPPGGSSSEKEKIGGTLSRYVEKCRVSSWRSFRPPGSFADPDNSTSDLRRAENPTARSHRSARHTPRKKCTPVRRYRLCLRRLGTCSRRSSRVQSWRAVGESLRRHPCRDLWASRSCSEGPANPIPALSRHKRYIYALSGTLISLDP